MLSYDWMSGWLDIWLVRRLYVLIRKSPWPSTLKWTSPVPDSQSYQRLPAAPLQHPCWWQLMILYFFLKCICRCTSSSYPYVFVNILCILMTFHPILFITITCVDLSLSMLSCALFYSKYAGLASRCNGPAWCVWLYSWTYAEVTANIFWKYRLIAGQPSIGRSTACYSSNSISTSANCTCWPSYARREAFTESVWILTLSIQTFIKIMLIRVYGHKTF